MVEHVRVDAKLRARSRFDLPAGEAHSWSIAEGKRPAWQAGQRFETITEAALPAWQIQSTLNLLSSEAFAADAASAVLKKMTAVSGPAGAEQVALATFDRYGFKAAAVTVMGVAVGAMRAPDEIGIERTVQLRFEIPSPPSP